MVTLIVSVLFNYLSVSQPTLKEIYVFSKIYTLESNCDSLLLNYKENTCGLMQIRPIMCKEVNYILGYENIGTYL